MKTIAAVTIGSIDVASSRLRSFYLFTDSEHFNYKVIRTESIYDIFCADVFHLQKVLSFKFYFTAVLRRLFGKCVVFDFDDQRAGFKSTLAMLANMLVANVVTTDTEYRKDFWNSYLPRKKIIVLPDVIDIDPNLQMPSIDLSVVNKCKKEIVWLGNANNIPSIIPLVLHLKEHPDLKMTLIVDSNSVAHVSCQYPWVEVVSWNKEIIYEKRFQGCSMVLNHGIDSEGLLKSDNKMVLAIAAGIVPVVSNTPAYMALASIVNSENLVFSNISDVVSIINSLDKNWIYDFFRRSRQVIIQKYGHHVLMSKLDTVLSDLS